MGSLIVITLILALTFYSYHGRAGSDVAGKLGIEKLFAAIGVQLNEDLQRDVARYREIYANQGFMALYRECYGIALDSHGFDFDRQFAAVSSLLIISKYELDSEPLRASAQRLFINFCRMSLVDKITAVQINEVAEKYCLFKDNPEVQQLWDDYLQHVWERDLRPRIRRYGVIDENDEKFIQLRDKFAAETLALMNHQGRNVD
ncbi:MAG: hypothetical protein CVV41_02805 [Candidatus Riflebacteria bacterium HGW-Riflebacteria-1]|nr:MAG: hypothetical protein CVV41_02805 [Candidatus Riflebacteria bacterium HGW-Riflebacteria-1]